MAEGVLFKIAEGIIGQLGNTALQEIGLLWGVNNELEKLKNTVTAIQAVLLDAEEKQALNNAIKTWLGRLKDVVFEADDLLDDLSTEALRREAMTQNKKAKQAIREKLDAIEADNKQFGLVERLNETQVKTRPRQEAHFFEHAKAIIGRENEKEEIIKLILNSDNEENVSVLPIVGIGGMGKTTLAQLVFNDEEIKNHFEFLRLLDLHNMGIEIVPSSISKVEAFKELSRLNDLRGDLQIRNLRHGKDAALELKDANLKAKQYLKSFSLEWKKEEVNDTDVVYDEQSLECLQPHPNLKVLCFLSFQGVRFPSWLSSLTNLQYLQLHSCGKCQHLPLLDFFPFLKVMRLIYLDSLEHINSEKLSDSPILPSLKRLIIIGCPNLKGWWRRMDSVEDGNYVGITATETFMAKDNLVPSFPCLSSLIITNCPQLNSMPLFPYLENLHLEHSSMKPLQQTMMMGMTSMTTPEIITSTTEIASTSSSFSSVATSSFASLSKLKRLALRGMVEPLTEELLRNFTSINHLDIHNSCPLTRVLRHLTALQSLYISDFDGDEMEWQELNSLSTLGFLNFSKVSLPVGLQHVTSLKSLKIQDCPSLVTIPEWICNLTSLQQLDIRNCPNLTSLPEGIRALTSLQKLTIKECPVLLKRCKRETDEDWSKIAHIPNLDMYEGDSEPEKPDLKKTWHLTKIFGHCNCSTSQQLNDKLKELPLLILRCEKLSDSPILQSLKSLYIQGCPNLKGWWRREDSVEDGNYLTSMPLFPNLETLYLKNSSVKPLQQTVMRMTNTTPPEIVTSTTEIASTSSSSSVATSSFAPLSKLKSLTLSGMVEPLPEELLRNFTSINHLDIHNSCCPLTRVLRTSHCA
uniref:Rx N-terminal domain-containing protein n=1 Tax=Fagus sylvatica TaxID=28930 RepID=A0A2N9IVE9_FAGSY